MIKVLSIGNSFSQDAQRYLHLIAQRDGVQLHCANLYIGGCSLQTHCHNLHSGEAAYTLERNGESTGLMVSIHQALSSDCWDYVTLQQVSQLSIDFGSYIPYLSQLVSLIRELVPGAKLLLHQTWAYQQGSQRLCEELGFHDQKDMLHQLRCAYAQAAREVRADGIIPCGEAMMNALELGVDFVHRDTFHASFGLGRYLLGLTWYMTLTGRKPGADSPSLDEFVSDNHKSLALQAAEKAVFNIIGR